MNKDKIAKSKSEWWELARKGFEEWNLNAHPEDRMSFPDWIGEIGTCHGWRPFLDKYGDWEITKV